MAVVRRPGAYECGIDAAMDVIGGKWKVLILWALHEQPHRRFGELRRLLPGITEKVLASHLREMEADGIVHRTSYDEVPPRVEYSLTENGIALNTRLMGNALYSYYLDGDILISGRYERRGDSLFVELASVATKDPLVSEIKEDGVRVQSYRVGSVQNGELKRKSSR